MVFPNVIFQMSSWNIDDDDDDDEDECPEIQRISLGRTPSLVFGEG